MISRNGDEAMRSYYVYLGKCVQSFLPTNFHMNPGVAAKELLVNFRSVELSRRIGFKDT